MTTKEDLKATLEAMTDADENTVFFSDTAETIRFQIQPDSVICINNDTAKAQVDSQIMDMCFMMTGDTVLPEGMGSDYLQKFAVDEKTAKDHVDALVSYEVIANEYAAFVFKDLYDSCKRSIGRYAGHLLRHYPAINEGIHPFAVASTAFSSIPENMVKNCADVWEHMSPEDRRQFSDSVETYTKIIYCSAVDQLNRVLVSLKKGGASIRVSLSHPATSPLPDFCDKEQPILDRAAAYGFLDSLHFWVSPGTTELTLQVKLTPCEVQTVYYQVLPMFSFLLSKVAAECNLIPVSLEIISDLTYHKSNAETKELLTTLVSDNALAILPIPDFVPKKSVVNFTVEDFQIEKES